MEKRNGPSPLQATLIILGCLISIAFIIFLKMKSDLRSPIYAMHHPEVLSARRTADSIANVAIPDTTITPDAMPHVPDTVAAAPPDSMGIDTRPIAEAGLEDGRLAGLEDGRHGTLRANFDSTSTFPTDRQRQAYAAAYAEGYTQGYEEGLRHVGEKHTDEQTTPQTEGENTKISTQEEQQKQGE